ncbi:alpha/beta fold hydrolase [Actinomycetes bacterium M1A6_2h]
MTTAGRSGGGNWAGLIGGAASIAAIGAAAGVTALRRTVRRRGPDPLVREDFTLMNVDRGSIVAADDGVPLAVREVGPVAAPLTVVFVHGYCLRMESWHFQRRELARRWGQDVRMVFYDQRGHGRSDRGRAQSCTIAQLGADLAAVIRAVAPTGPVVMVGHSMGGMTVLAAAGQFPDLFTERVVGVGLLSTTAAGLAQTGLGRNLENPAVDAFRLAVRTAPGVIQFGRGVVRSLISPVLLAASYGTDVSPALVHFSESMINGTSVVTMVNFLKSLELHDETNSLTVLADIPALVLCGDDDWVIPFRKSEELADGLPLAEIVRVRRAGHLVQLEFASEVDDAIDRLIARARTHRRSGPRRGAAEPRRRTVG